MNVIPMTQCRKCTAFNQERKCLNRPDLLTSLSPGRKRRCLFTSQGLKALHKNFVEFTNKAKTAAFSIRQLTGSTLKLKSSQNVIASDRKKRSNLILLIINFFKNLIRTIRGKK